MNTLPKVLRAELLSYYGYDRYARRAAPAIWPPAKSTELTDTDEYIGRTKSQDKYVSQVEYIGRAVSQGCRASLELICRAISYPICKRMAVRHPLDLAAWDVDDIRMAKYLLRSVEKRAGLTDYILKMGLCAARRGRRQILRLCRASLLPAYRIEFYDKRITIWAASFGQTACVLMGLKEWDANCAQRAMEVAAEDGHLETFLLCHKWGGRVTDDLICELENRCRWVDAGPDEQRLKIVIDKCRELCPRDKLEEADRTYDNV